MVQLPNSWQNLTHSEHSPQSPRWKLWIRWAGEDSQCPGTQEADHCRSAQLRFNPSSPSSPSSKVANVACFTEPGKVLAVGCHLDPLGLEAMWCWFWLSLWWPVCLCSCLLCFCLCLCLCLLWFWLWLWCVFLLLLFLLFLLFLFWFLAASLLVRQGCLVDTARWRFASCPSGSRAWLQVLVLWSMDECAKMWVITPVTMVGFIMVL